MLIIQCFHKIPYPWWYNLVHSSHNLYSLQEDESWLELRQPEWAHLDMNTRHRLTLPALQQNDDESALDTPKHFINSLAPGRFQFNFRLVVFKLTLVNGGWCISYEIALRWMPLDLTDDKSTLVQVMAWCCQATSHYLSQCWPRSMSPNGVTRPQWVNISRAEENARHFADHIFERLLFVFHIVCINWWNTSLFCNIFIQLNHWWHKLCYSSAVCGHCWEMKLRTTTIWKGLHQPLRVRWHQQCKR